MPVHVQPRHLSPNSGSRATSIGRFATAAMAFVLLSLILAGCTRFVVPPPDGEIATSPAPSEAVPEVEVTEPLNPVRAAALAEEATDLFKRSNFAEAEQKFLEALEADPSALPALTGLSDLYTYSPERWQEALSYAEQAYAIDPEDASVLSYLTWAQQLAHHFEDAIETSNAAIAADPESSLAHTVHADMALSLYEPQRALLHVNKALELDPDNALAYVLLSLVQESLHDWPASEESAAKAIELEPDFHLWKIVLSRRAFDLDGDPYSALEIAAPAFEALPNHPFVIGLEVDMAVELNEWEKALNGCARMAAVDSPETPYPDGYTCQANVSMLMEDYEAAEKFQDKAEEVAWDDRFDVSMTRMFLFNNAEECKESRSIAQKWLDARPYSMAAQRMMGVGFMCSDDWEEAIPFLQLVSNQLPTSVTDSRLLAISFARNEMKSEATKTLSEVKSLAFNDPLYYQAQYELNFILGDLDASIDNAQRWSIFRPYSSDANEAVAFAHLYNGNLDAAQKSAENALEKGSISSTVMSILGYSHLVRGEIDEAEQKLLVSVGKDPDMYLTQYSLSQLYLYTNRCEESEPHVEWLADQADTAEEKLDINSGLTQCYDRRTVAEDVQDDRISADLVRTKVLEEFEEQEIGLRFFEVMERADQKALVVLMSSAENPESVEFRREEIGASMFVSSFLPVMQSQPDALILVSEHEGQRIAMIVVETANAARWLNERLTNEEFIGSWRREDASNLPQDIFADLDEE